MPGVETCSYYYNKDSMHAKNEQTYIAHDQPSIFNKLLVNVPCKHICKNVHLLCPSTFLLMDVP
jgi:hypothetical protein